jgi:hypothetical protein
MYFSQNVTGMIKPSKEWNGWGMQPCVKNRNAYRVVVGKFECGKEKSWQTLAKVTRYY